MYTLDSYDLPVRQDDPGIFQQFGWSSSPPGIVMVVDPLEEDLWDHSCLAAMYGRFFVEITLDEEDTGEQIERYVSENGALVENGQETVTPPDSGDGKTLPEIMERIKSRLGIGMKHLSAALGVERPTAYAWMKGERLPQTKRWERVYALLDLADHWQGLSRHPLNRRVFIPMASGPSVMDLLSAETLDKAKIKEVLSKLAADENARSARLSHKAAAMRERMKAKGATPLPDEVVDQTMRDIGGWRH